MTEVDPIAGDAQPEWVAINLQHARAVLADDEPEAVGRFEEALSADLEHWPFWRGRLLLAYGRWLRRRRHIGDSRAPLREAREIDLSDFERIDEVDRVERHLRDRVRCPPT